MIRIAIVDDEKIILRSIHKKIENLFCEAGAKFEIYDYTDAVVALKEIEKSSFDILFLDIDMPQISGMEIAKKLRVHEENIDIVFITNKEELVYDAIKFTPFRFIRKYRFENEIEEAVNEFINKFGKNNYMYMFSTPQGKKGVLVTQIKYIEVMSHKLNVHGINESFIANGNLKDIEDMFYDYGFFRIHQSYLVNYRFINLIKHKEVILDNGTILPISRGKYEKIKFDYMRFSREI